MDLLLIHAAVTLLSLAPLFVTMLHVWVGLSWRADFLLGRLDTVRVLTERDPPSLHYQIIELFNHVKSFATRRKIREMSLTYKAMEARRGTREIYLGGPLFSKTEHELLFERLYLGLFNLFLTRWYRVLDNLRYFLPAIFLCALYIIGFQLILVRLPFIANQEQTASQSSVNDPQPFNTSLGTMSPYKQEFEDEGRELLEWWRKVPQDHVHYLAYAFLGTFVFNTGIMVRRIFVWDISVKMYWWAVYRVVLSIGLAEVVKSTVPNLNPHLYFLITAASVSILDGVTRNVRAKLFQSDAVPKQNELSLQLIQGIDYWKEQRLLEEWIESVQHLATSDFVLLALHTRAPLFTVMDWVDQAIFIQRFPGRAQKMADVGLPVSAVELTWGWSPENRDITGTLDNPSDRWAYRNYLKHIAEATAAKEEVVVRTLEAWRADNQVQLLTLFWRSDIGTEKYRQHS